MPLQVLLALLLGDGDHIEAAGALAMVWMLGEKALCRMNHAALFVDAYALQSADQPVSGALAHFDEDEGGFVQHDEIQLSATHMEIAREQLQFVTHKVIQRHGFGLVAGDLASRAFHRACS